MEKADRETEPKLNGLVEAALFVENLARACDFYEQVLGLTKIQLSNTGCVFRVADQRYLLLVAREVAQNPNETPYGVVPACAVPQHNDRGPGHIAFGIWRFR